ncbi:superinfection immunity protein [Aquitalea sp. ASV11]|uniref:superinfection immunity protein n=1 Tax=Aquitalea sp. ASV11 TaxID=2795103 RepID=UPI0018EDFE91|nr:superinfection immunity protein [Aquitalea sp. ASV11]
MKIVDLLKGLFIIVLALAVLLWLYGTFNNQPLFVTTAMWMGDALVMIPAYLIPSITGWLVKSPRLQKVVLINVLGGWLILPWIIAMGMAIKRDDLRTQD